MGGHAMGAREGAVELVNDLIEARRVRETVALADVYAQHVAKALACFVRQVRRLAPGLAELGELAGLAEVEQVSPDLGARGLWVGVVVNVRLVEAFEVRGVRQVVGR